MGKPSKRPLKIVRESDAYVRAVNTNDYVIMLSNLAVANAYLWSKGKDAGETHYIAIIKELERVCEFHFENYEGPPVTVANIMSAEEVEDALNSPAGEETILRILEKRGYKK